MAAAVALPRAHPVPPGVMPLRRRYGYCQTADKHTVIAGTNVGCSFPIQQLRDGPAIAVGYRTCSLMRRRTRHANLHQTSGTYR